MQILNEIIESEMRFNKNESERMNKFHKMRIENIWYFLPIILNAKEEIHVNLSWRKKNVGKNVNKRNFICLLLLE